MIGTRPEGQSCKQKTKRKINVPNYKISINDNLIMMIENIKFNLLYRWTIS